MNKYELNIDWNFFMKKFQGRETAAFEQMSYLLFLSETGNPQGLFRFKNHPGIETEPIIHNGKLSGFQAKYLTSLKDGKDDVIDSINKTKSYYPLVKDYYIYTNCESGVNYKSKGLKPSYISDIESAAKAGGMTIVWRVPSHIEAQLALPQNRYIYDIYFGDNQSDPIILLEEIETHNDMLLAPIKESISFHDSSIHIDRNEITENILSNLTPGSATIVAGEGGSGKTALFKHIYNEHHKDFPIIIFKATELKHKSADEIVEFNNKFTFQSFLDAFNGEEKKCFVVDSAERLAELDNQDTLLPVFRKLLANKWSLLFLTRTVYQSVLLSFLRDGLGILPFLTDIPLLSEKVLESIAINNAFNLPENPRFLSRLRNLFYLREYLSYYDDIDKKGSDGDFIDKLWSKVIQGPSINNGINVSRDKCMVTIARHRADSGDFYTDGDSLPSDALFALTQDEILSIGNDRGGYFITHDIYEEWALRKIIDREWRRSPDCHSFFKNVGDSLPIRKALRMWLFDKLQENELGLPDILSEAFSESELPQFWLDEILVACMLSDKAHQFFAFFEDRIIADAYSLFKRILFLLQIACMKPHQFFREMMVPTGKGWEAAISCMHSHKTDFFANNLGICIPVLKIWTSNNKRGSATLQSGELAFSVLDKALKSERYLVTDIDKQILSIIFDATAEIKDQVRSLIRLIIDTPAVNKSYFMRVVCEKILVEPYSIEVIHELPLEVLTLGESWWSFSPEHNEDDEEEVDWWYRRHNLTQENKFGLSNNTDFHYFPASANQTPLLQLLHVSPNATLDFIIRFVNHFVESYYKCGYDPNVEEVEFHINAITHKQYCSRSLWECYRGSGTPVTPYFIQSIHMALEKFLLQIFDKYETADIKWILIKILKESKSASLSAVVASIVVKYQDKLPDITLTLFGVPQFLELDSVRSIHEHEVKTLAGMGAGLSGLKDELYVKERLKECESPHRQESLEGLILKYQYARIGCMSEAEQTEYIANIHKIIDGFRESSEVMERMSNIIEHIDLRNLKPEVIGKTEEGTVIQFKPIHRSEHSVNSGEKALRQADEVLKYSSLHMWSSLIDKDLSSRTAKMKEYDEHPEIAMAELKSLLLETKNMSQMARYLNQGVPVQVASKLLREFQKHISSADRDCCRDIVLEAFQNLFQPGYFYQEGDGTKEAIYAIPYLLTLYPETANDTMIELAFSMVRFLDGNSWRILCQKGPEAIVQSGLWEKDSEIAKTILAYYLELQKLAYSEKGNLYDALDKLESLNGILSVDNIDCSDIYVLNNVLISLPITSNDELILSIYEKICRELPYRFLNETRRTDDPEENPYNSSVFTDFRYAIFHKLAKFLLSLDSKEAIKRFFLPLIEKAKGGRHTDSLIRAFIVENENERRSEQFLIIWELLYSKMLLYNHIPNFYMEETLVEYLLSASYWKKDVREWHSFGIGMLRLFERVAKDFGTFDITLFCMAKVFCTIGSKYIDVGLDCIHNTIIRSHFTLNSRHLSNTLYYLEQFINQYWLLNTRKIRENNRFKSKVKDILTFMMELGSAKAYRFRDLL